MFIQLWRPLANYAVKTGVVCLQVKLCDPHLTALEVRECLMIGTAVAVQRKNEECVLDQVHCVEAYPLS